MIVKDNLIISSDTVTKDEIIFLVVDEGGTILEYNPVTQFYVDTNNISFEKLLPHNHIEIVTRCLETGKGERGRVSVNSNPTLVWDYYPLLENNCIHIYGMPPNDDDIERQIARSIIDTGINFATILEADGTIRFISNSVTDYLEIDPDEIKGTSGLSLVHPDDKEIVQACIQSIIDERDCIVTMEYRAMFKDGSWRSFESTAYNMLYDPLINGILVYTREITEKKKKYDHLKKQEEEFRQFLDCAADAIIVYDKNKTIHYANIKTTELLGYNHNELNGHRIDTLFPEYDRRDKPLLYSNGTRNGAVIVERAMIRKDGLTVTVESSEQMFPDGRYQIIARDISKRKNSDDEFRKAVKSEIYEKLFIKLRLFKHGEGMLMNLNRLALFVENAGALQQQQVFDRFSIASSEYQKIIYPELNSIGKLLQALYSDDEQSRSAGISLPRGKSIINLSNKLKESMTAIDEQVKKNNLQKSITVINEKKNDVKTTIARIKKVITETTRTIEQHFICPLLDTVTTTVKKYQAEHSNIEIRLIDRLNNRSAIMNCSEIGEIIDILIENSIDAMNEHNVKTGDKEKKSEIQITMSVRNNKIRIVVEDNGPGVPEEYRNLVFKEGFSTKGPGHGFGLSYSKKCVTKYGGVMYYEHRKNTGACFVIELLRAYSE